MRRYLVVSLFFFLCLSSLTGELYLFIYKNASSRDLHIHVLADKECNRRCEFLKRIHQLLQHCLRLFCSFYSYQQVVKTIKKTILLFGRFPYHQHCNIHQLLIDRNTHTDNNLQQISYVHPRWLDIMFYAWNSFLFHKLMKVCISLEILLGNVMVACQTK